MPIYLPFDYLERSSNLHSKQEKSWNHQMSCNVLPYSFQQISSQSNQAKEKSWNGQDFKVRKLNLPHAGQTNSSLYLDFMVVKTKVPMIMIIL